MSRMYRANISIENQNPGRETAIAEVLMDVWGFADVVASRHGLEAEVEVSLGGGVREEEFARALTQRVWAINQGFCKVSVNMTYLEELPSEAYVFSSRDEYDAWLKTSGESRL